VLSFGLTNTTDLLYGYGEHGLYGVSGQVCRSIHRRYIGVVQE
jgi:hypothetical protein